MANVFIGWSGNQNLAYCLEKLIQSGDHEAIVGGGTPKERFVGMQVINQINQCSYAVLLVEDRKDIESETNAISNNLMFEWGYIMAKFPYSCIFTMLIDKESKDLPSDLQGSSVSSFVRTSADGSEKPDEVLAFEIYNVFKGYFDKIEENEAFFDTVNNWKRVYSNLSERRINDEIKKIKQILLGCYAAYYYNGYQEFRELLNEFSGGRSFTEVVTFAKAYIDVFLFSSNMTKPITKRQFRNLCDIYRDTLDRNRSLPAEIDLLVDLLCHNAFSLAYVLFLRNDEVDEGTKTYYAENAIESLLQIDETLKKFEEVKTDECLSLLIRSYLYNDMSHIYRDYVQNEENLKSYLVKSVEARRELYRAYKRNYPKNHYLITKFDQEYVVALSDLCYYIEDKKERRSHIEDIEDKFDEWESEISYSTSLLRRIKKNLKRIGVEIGDF